MYRKARVAHGGIGEALVVAEAAPFGIATLLLVSVY